MHVKSRVSPAIDVEVPLLIDDGQLLPSRFQSLNDPLVQIVSLMRRLRLLLLNLRLVA